MTPDSAAPVRFADARLSTGVRIHCAEGGDADGHPLILLHGLSDSWFSYSRVLPLLAPAHHAWAIDQRGHGDSDRPPRGYAVRDLAADVVAFMDYLHLERATLVGHSMGSLVALAAALEHSARIPSLVLIGSGTYLRSEEMLEFKRACDRLDGAVPRDFALQFQLSTIHHPVPDDFLETAVNESLKVPARVWQDALAGLLAVDYADRLREVTVPVLLLRGDSDTTFPPAAQEALANGLPHAITRVYRDTGHAVHWERPAEFVRDVTSFTRE